MSRRLVLVILGAAAFLALLLAVVPRLPYRLGGDGTTTGVRLVQDAGEVSLYFNRSRWVPEQLVPYRDVFIEYPQLAAFYLAWPRFLGVDFPTYAALLLWTNGLTLVGLIAVSRQLARALPVGRLRAWWLFLLPSTLYFTLYRFDVLPALAVAASLLALVRRRLGWSLILLAAGIAIKWYPLVLLPLYWHWSRRMGLPRTHVLQAFGLVGGAMVVLTLIAWVTYGQGFLAPYLVHLQRTFEPGTVYVLLAPAAGDTRGGAVASAVRVILGVLQIAMPIVWLFRGAAFRQRLSSSTAFIAWCALAVGAFILFAKFHSPQWHLWLLPLLVLLPLPRWVIAMIVAHDVVSFVQFPILYDTVGPTTGWYLAAASIRTALLVGLLIVVARIAVRRSPDAPAPLSADRHVSPPRDVHASPPV